MLGSLAKVMEDDETREAIQANLEKEPKTQEEEATLKKQQKDAIRSHFSVEFVDDAWRKAIQFARDHAKKEPTKAQMQSLLDLFPDNLREELDIPTKAKYEESKIRLRGWQGHASMAYSVCYLCYWAWMDTRPALPAKTSPPPPARSA